LREELANLIRLQQVDDSLLELEMELGDLPEQVEHLRITLEEGSKSIEEYEAEIKENLARRKVMEVEIDSLNEQLKKFKEQIYLVQTNKEYDAINSEIDVVQETVHENENEVLQLYSREEELKELLKELRSTQVTASEEYKEKDADLKQKLAETEDEKIYLENERQKIIVRLKKPVYNHYERIRKARDGKGVAYVYNDACGGCFSTIPPQRLVEIENMTDFIFCETCGRVLVFEPED
jgi:uncharacterized protein